MTTPSNNVDRLKAIALLGAIAIILLVVCAAVFVTIEGRSFEQALGPLIGYTTPTVIALIGFATLNKRVDDVHEKVNGNFHTMLETNRQLGKSIAEIAETASDPSKGGTPNADQHPD